MKRAHRGIPQTETRTLVHARVAAGIVDRIDAEAQANGQTRTEIIRLALAAYIHRDTRAILDRGAYARDLAEAEAAGEEPINAADLFTSPANVNTQTAAPVIAQTTPTPAPGAAHDGTENAGE